MRNLRKKQMGDTKNINEAKRNEESQINLQIIA